MVVTVVIGLIVLFKVLGLGQYFTLTYVKASQEKFAAVYADHRLIITKKLLSIYRRN